MKKHIPYRKLMSVHHIRSEEDFPEIEPSAFIIDAIFGHGINRPADGIWLHLIRHINAAPNKVVSIDITTGLNPDSELENAKKIHAVYTLTVVQHTLTFYVPALVLVVA